MGPTAMLALEWDLNAYTSFWTSTAAAEIFWTVFAVGLCVTLLIAVLRPRTKTKPRLRTRIYDIPPPASHRRPVTLAELFARRARDAEREEVEEIVERRWSR